MTADDAISEIRNAPDRKTAAAIRSQWVWDHPGVEHRHDVDRVCQAVIDRWGEALLGQPSRPGEPPSGG